MEAFLNRGSKKVGGASSGNAVSTVINTTADKEMKDETKPKFTPWVEK